MRTLVTALCLFTATAFVSTELPTGQVEARKKRKKRSKKKKKKRKTKLKATKATFTGITKLMGKFKWGMSNTKVLQMIRAQIRAEEEPILKKIKDPLEQDKRRREMFAKLRKVKKNYVEFLGKRTPWDVSLVDKEFAHKNNESMAVVWKKKERRFYFFHHGQLWKVFIAFNAEMFEDKTFEDFAQVMEKRFGSAERKFTVTLKGEQKMDHLAWPKAGRTKMLAYDLTAFYGNFCLSLVDMNTWSNVKHGRELNSPKRKYSDPLVKAVTTPGGSGGDANEDIVDRITGKGTTAPSVGGSSGGTPSSPRPGYSPPRRPKKKLDPKNPLKGLDI
jgi:hypothetical protein